MEEHLYAIRRRLDILQGQREEITRQDREIKKRLETINNYLEISADISAGLDLLSDRMFDGIIRSLEESLTAALHEVLGQPVELKVNKSVKRGAVNLEFCLQRNGLAEDIMRGTGGSVANVLSVGLRFFALSTLDPKKHRRFVVLDEQDCWLKPELVPKLVNVIHLAAKTLGFQTLVISHHDLAFFAPYADRVFHFHPSPTGVEVNVLDY